MADDSEDLVSQIKVTGGPAATAEIQQFADKGAAAFDKLNRSAATASGGVASSTAAVSASSKRAAADLQAVDKVPVGANLVSNLKNIENAVGNLTSKFPQLTQAIGRFTQRFALVGAAAVAGAIGLATAARNVAKQVDGENDSLKKMTETQIDANNASLASQVSAINQASSFRQLFAQFQSGKITYQQYNDQLKALVAQEREQAIVAAQVENAQARVKEANDKLNKSLADRTALNKLIDTFGGPLLTSLVSFGRQVEQTHAQFLASFGPSAAGIIDVIGGVLAKNSSNITKFFDQASKQIDSLLKNNGPQIEKLLENIGSAAASVFTGILNAAPALIDFINNTLAPAIGKVSALFSGLATAINFVFGTNLTGGSIVLIAILAQMTGSIKLLFSLVRTGGAVFKGFIAIVEAVGVTIAEAFGATKVAQIVKLTSTVSKGGGPVKAFLAILRSAIPLIVVLGEAVAAALGIGFAPAIILIGLLAAALIFLIKNVDWTKFLANAKVAIAGVIAFFSALPGQISGFFAQLWADITALAGGAAQGILDAWAAVVTFFSTTLPTAVTSAFQLLWTGITSAANIVAQGVVTAWNATVAFFQNLPSQIGAFFTALWEATKATAVAAAQAVVDAFNTFVTFVTGLPDQLAVIWTTVGDALRNAFNTAIQTVISYFADLFAKAKSYLQPIIDLLTKINSLTADTGSGGGPAAVEAAGGGHIRGPGTGTSDSIAAWLSNNEFVVKAKSVAKYGLGFMNAVNSGRFKMPRFNMGGLNMIAPSPGRSHFVDGGPVKTGRPISLSIFGETFDGLTAPDDVADRLSRFAINRQVRSAGRKPSWVGGNS